MAEFKRVKVDETAIDRIGTVVVVSFREHRFSELLEIERLGEELYRLIEDSHHRKWLLDFSDVEFFSSAAIGKLISLNGRVKARGGVLKLCSLRPDILDVFHVCKLDRVFDIRQDRAEALVAFGP